MASTSNPAKILRLFADIQDRLHNGIIENQINNIAKYTRDQEILADCKKIAECLELPFDPNSKFEKCNDERFAVSVHRIAKHLESIKNKYDNLLSQLPDYNSKWTESLFQLTESQLVKLSEVLILLDRVPNNFDVSPGDLVIYPCQDDEGKNYDHYGVVISTPQGYMVAHFFSGPTIQAPQKFIEKGIGYVHTVPYTPDWILKEHLPDSIPYAQVENRIRESRNIESKIWHIVSYNCEHWAREMVYGEKDCTQRTDKVNERRANRHKNS